MGRWKPDARERLAQAALTLYAEQGFDQTTVAEIAASAGLTEATFFRHFADKREVLFYNMDIAQGMLAQTVANAPVSATPMDAVAGALYTGVGLLQHDPEQFTLVDAITSANAKLRERELAKYAAFAAGMASALRDRGTPEPIASLAAETGIAVLKVALARWTSEPDRPDLTELLRESLAAARCLFTDSLLDRVVS